MTSDRFGSISGLLTDKPPSRRATVHPIAGDATEQPGPVATPRPTRRSGAPATRPASEKSTGASRRVAFRLEPDLHARLVAAAKSGDSTLGNVVLDAVEAAHTAGRLGDLVATAKNRPTSAPTTLFVRSAPRESAKPSVPVEIQLHTQAVDQLDQLVAEHGADNRTQLMVAALQAYLDPQA